MVIKHPSFLWKCPIQPNFQDQWQIANSILESKSTHPIGMNFDGIRFGWIFSLQKILRHNVKRVMLRPFVKHIWFELQLLTCLYLSLGRFVPQTTVHWKKVKKFVGTRVGCKCKMCPRRNAIYNPKKHAIWKLSLCQGLCLNLTVSKYPRRSVLTARQTPELWKNLSSRNGVTDPQTLLRPQVSHPQPLIALKMKSDLFSIKQKGQKPRKNKKKWWGNKKIKGLWRKIHLLRPREVIITWKGKNFLYPSCFLKIASKE